MSASVFFILAQKALFIWKVITFAINDFNLLDL